MERHALVLSVIVNLVCNEGLSTGGHIRKWHLSQIVHEVSQELGTPVKHDEDVDLGGFSTASRGSGGVASDPVNGLL